MTDDTIYRQAAIGALRAMQTYKMGAGDDMLLIDQAEAQTELMMLPSAQQTLYGYKIEHLAYIARVMEKEGVTAEYAVRTFDDMSRVIKMIIDEIQQKVEEALNG